MVLLRYLPEIATCLLLIMMGTQLPSIGAILILIEFALVGALFVFRTTAFFDVVARWWWLLLMPAISVLSAVWSSVPMISARYGAQFLFTCFVGVLLARLMTPKRFVCTLMVALFIFLILCVLNGRTGTSADGWVLIGLTGSKNQLGYAAQVLFLASITVLLLPQVDRPLRWLAWISLPFAIFLTIGAHSATALLMAIGGGAALLALGFSQRMTPGGRMATILLCALIVAPLLLLAPEISAFLDHFLYDTLGKDPTLTGRVFLWERADALIARQPIFGYGYQAIWMGDSSDTIGLKRLAGIEDGRQFHFHNQFRQVAVDTGLIGLVPFVSTLVITALASFRQTLLRPEPATSFFFMIFVLMVSRSFTDLIIAPFSVHTLLFFVSSVYAFAPPQQVAQQAAPPPAMAWRRGRPASA